MLRTWFHDPEVPDESHLDSFNAIVKEQLAPAVLKHAGGSTLPLSYTLYACAACILPDLPHRTAGLLRAAQRIPLGPDVVVHDEQRKRGHRL